MVSIIHVWFIVCLAPSDEQKGDDENNYLPDYIQM